MAEVGVRQVICTKRRSECGCIKAVGTIERTREDPETDPDVPPTEMWEVSQLVPVMRVGTIEFFTYSGGEISEIGAFRCDDCDEVILDTIGSPLGSRPDSTTKDNLGSLPACGS